MDFATFRASADNVIPDTYKMRYLVCRLDGYAEPTVFVEGYGPMPQDVKNMIDRGRDSEGQERPVRLRCSGRSGTPARRVCAGSRYGLVSYISLMSLGLLISSVRFPSSMLLMPITLM